ncbi:MAG: hypothetical protein H0T62_02545 [Parachlamydiaceae bacterium]|nr:hypothetical protein [Parachlamydiaceae bacterium]
MNEISSLRIGSGSELPLQASKWLEQQLLIDAPEMESLFSALGDFTIFKVGYVCKSDEGEVSKSDFLDQYNEYIECLKKGKIPEEQQFRSLFSSIFTVENDHLFQILVAGDRRIIRVEKPVLQLQVHHISYSTVDGKFRAMVFGKDSILWGIQFSYPQLYLEAGTKEVFSVVDSNKFPNTAFYRKLQLWVRQNTIPTPFHVMGNKINVPMRIGKLCLPWINNHPQLISNGIKVV